MKDKKNQKLNHIDETLMGTILGILGIFAVDYLVQLFKLLQINPSISNGQNLIVEITNKVTSTSYFNNLLFKI